MFCCAACSVKFSSWLALVLRCCVKDSMLRCVALTAVGSPLDKVLLKAACKLNSFLWLLGRFLNTGGTDKKFLQSLNIVSKILSDEGLMTRFHLN